MSYKITIIKTEEITERQQSNRTEVVDKRPWTDDELAKASTYYGGEQKFLETNPMKEVWGYPPSRDVLTEKETEVLKQTVDELDLAAVIKAINKL